MERFPRGRKEETHEVNSEGHSWGESCRLREQHMQRAGTRTDLEGRKDTTPVRCQQVTSQQMRSEYGKQPYSSLQEW